MANILVVDDSRVNQHMLRHILRKGGHSVTTAGDGHQALAALDQNLADVILSDISMPNMDGFELVQTLQTTAGFQQLPVVMITATGDDENQQRAHEMGIDGLLTRPFDSAELLRIITEIVGED